MTIHNENELDRVLDSWRIGAPRAGFTDAIAGHALAHPQRKSLWQVFSQQVTEIYYDMFGRPQDSVPLGSRWRLAGAMMVLVIGFASGYLSEMPLGDPDVADLTATLDVNDEELPEAI